jgi:coenzyme Q-binding protein COQ10
MPSHEERRVLPFTPEEMFAIVADVEKYPEFVPGCSALRIRKRETKGDLVVLTAEMMVAFRGLRERYTSIVTLNRLDGAIDARHLEGPFERLDTRWRFRPRDPGCEVHFFIDFAFRSRILSTVAHLFFDGVARRMTDAFVARAEKLHGASYQISNSHQLQ